MKWLILFLVVSNLIGMWLVNDFAKEGKYTLVNNKGVTNEQNIPDNQSKP